MHALLLGLLLAVGPAANSPSSKASTKTTPAKTTPDPGKAVKPFRVKIVNDYAESAFTVSYVVTFADGSPAAKGTLAKAQHIKAGSSEKLDGEVPVKNANDKVSFTMSAMSLGETKTWTFTEDMTKKLRTFVIVYDYDAATAEFRVTTKWGIL